MEANITNIKEYSSGEPFLSVYPDYDLNTLPKWILDNLNDARVVGKSKQTIILPDSRKYHLNNKLNHLTGSEWTYFINSIVNTRYKTTGSDSYAYATRKIHPSPKPPQLMRDIIMFFTKEKELVFDCFMGVGGTLLGAALCNRKAAGIDLSSSYIAAYKEAAKELDLPRFDTMSGDAINILSNSSIMNQLTGGDIISLLLLDPPYSNMMSKTKTGADMKLYGNSSTPFTDSTYDLGNMEYEDYLEKLKQSILLALPYMKNKGHVVVFSKDMQPSKKEPNLIHADVINKINEVPALFYKGMKIWADQTSKLFPYGYPFSFVANQIHQYIIVFRIED